MVRGAKKRFVPNSFQDPMGSSNKWFYSILEPVVTLFSPLKIPKCLENGPFWDRKSVKNWVKNGFFQKVYISLYICLLVHARRPNFVLAWNF